MKNVAQSAMAPQALTKSKMKKWFDLPAVEVGVRGLSFEI